jgi:hypothetical protein
MSQHKKNQINRREFLVTGSLVAAGMSLPSIASAAPKTAAALPLSVGFLGENSSTLQSAESVLSGDPTLFSRGARFSFRGMQRFASDRMQVAIDVIFRTDVGDLPFYAFTHGEEKKSASDSSPSSFLVPVPTNASIDLLVKATRASSAEAQATVSFAVNTVRNALKLNRGAYIFGFSDRAIDWPAVRLAEDAVPSSFVSGSSLLRRSPSGQDVTFDYIVMTVRAAA